MTRRPLCLRLAPSVRPGTRFDFDVAPDSAKALATVQRAGITLKAADIAIITAKQPK